MIPPHFNECKSRNYKNGHFAKITIPVHVIASENPTQTISWIGQTNIKIHMEWEKARDYSYAQQGERRYVHP